MNKTLTKTIIMVMLVLITFCIGGIVNNNSYVSEYSLKNTVNTKIKKISISRYKGDSLIIINQRSEDFIVFLTDSSDNGARCYKITKDGVKSLVYLAAEYNNDSEIEAIYYSEDDVKLISIRK